jgi:hypothetical protein
MAQDAWVWDESKKKWVKVETKPSSNGQGVTTKPGSVNTNMPSYIATPFGAYRLSDPYADVVEGNKPSKGQPPVLSGPGQWGPVGSAQQAAGVIRNKYGIQEPGPSEQELDTYDPLGGVGAILKEILGGGGSGSGGSKSKPTISRAALKKALESARKEIGSAYDSASSALPSIFANNPYAGLQAQESTVDPGLSALFQSQGVSTTPLEQMVASNREAAGQRNAAMNDMYKMLAGQFAQQAAQQQANVSQQRAGSLDELLQNYAAILGSGKVY